MQLWLGPYVFFMSTGRAPFGPGCTCVERHVRRMQLDAKELVCLGLRDDLIISQRQSAM